MIFFEYKAHRKKQGAGIVTYVKPLARNNAVFGKNHVDLTFIVDEFFRIQGAPEKARRRLTYVSQAAFEEQRRSRKKSRRLAITFALKCRAHSIRTLFRMSRTYMDIFRSAIALAVVIYAVLNRAIYALDVLFALSRFVHHNKRPFVIK